MWVGSMWVGSMWGWFYVGRFYVGRFYVGSVVCVVGCRPRANYGRVRFVASCP